MREPRLLQHRDRALVGGGGYSNLVPEIAETSRIGHERRDVPDVVDGGKQDSRGSSIGRLARKRQGQRRFRRTRARLIRTVGRRRLALRDEFDRLAEVTFLSQSRRDLLTASITARDPSATSWPISTEDNPGLPAWRSRPIRRLAAGRMTGPLP